MDAYAYLNLARNFFTTLLPSHLTLSYYNLFALAGLYFIGSRFLKLLCWTKKYFLTCEPNYKQKYGDNWVVITGGTDGIGKSLAKEFVKRGHKLLLISRSETKAVEVIKELKEVNPNATIEFIVYDLDRHYTAEDMKELEEKLTPYKQVSILVNNAGIGSLKRFDTLTTEEINSIININLKSITFCTRAILPKMKENKRSLIVFSGSGLYLVKPAGCTVYAGSKCYMEGFMTCLTQEYDNIDFSYLELGPVYTKMNRSKIRGMITPDECAAGLIRHMGKYEFTAGSYKHGIFSGLMKTNQFFINTARRMMKKVYMKKQDAKNK